MFLFRENSTRKSSILLKSGYNDFKTGEIKYEISIFSVNEFKTSFEYSDTVYFF